MLKINASGFLKLSTTLCQKYLLTCNSWFSVMSYSCIQKMSQENISVVLTSVLLVHEKYLNDFEVSRSIYFLGHCSVFAQR